MNGQPNIFGNKNSLKLLLLNKNFQINSVTSISSGMTEDIFIKGLHVFDEVNWLGNFINSPNRIEKNQILYTIDGKTILYFLHHIEEPVDEIFYIISLLDPTEINTMDSLLNKESTLESSDFIMISEPMQRISKIINTISNVDSTVLLLGESGVGKSAIATIIHRTSSRSHHPFISINCGSIPENLIETELFGYESGTFTGGMKGGKMGLFEAADKGTIFLDEISELPFNLQSKLLSVLQESTVRRIGSTKTKKINVRVIAATNNDIKKLVKKKLFREDLYYRLNVIPLTIPPLRERKEDIPLLIDSFLAKFNKRHGLKKRLSDQLKGELLEYNWPGNIRELENMIERIAVTNLDDEIDNIFQPTERYNRHNVLESVEIMPLKQAKKELEKALILKAVNVYGNTYKAADALGIDQSTVSKKMKLYKEGEL